MKTSLIHKARVSRIEFTIPTFLLVAALVGCTSPTATKPEPVPEPPNAPEVVAAENLFNQGKVQDAITATIDITRKNPSARGLNDLYDIICFVLG